MLRHLRSKVLIALALSACSLAAANAANPAYVGVWGTSIPGCKAPSDSSGAPIRITAKRIDVFESRCDMRGIKRVNGAWTAKVRCQAAGEADGNARVTLWASRNLLTLKWSTSTSRLNYVRCR
jgi:hypothetical protein